MTVTIVARAAGGTKDSMVTIIKDLTRMDTSPMLGTMGDINPVLTITDTEILANPEKAAMMTGAAEAVTMMTGTAEAVTMMEDHMVAATVGGDINKMILQESFPGLWPAHK